MVRTARNNYRTVQLDNMKQWVVIKMSQKITDYCFVKQRQEAVTHFRIRMQEGGHTYLFLQCTYLNFSISIFLKPSTFPSIPLICDKSIVSILIKMSCDNYKHTAKMIKTLMQVRNKKY